MLSETTLVALETLECCNFSRRSKSRELCLNCEADSVSIYFAGRLFIGRCGCGCHEGGKEAGKCWKAHRCKAHFLACAPSPSCIIGLTKD